MSREGFLFRNRFDEEQEDEANWLVGCLSFRGAPLRETIQRARRARAHADDLPAVLHGSTLPHAPPQVQSATPKKSYLNPSSHAGGWRCHASFERRRDALVFLDTTAAAAEGESVTTLRFAPDRLEEFDELIADALNNPAPVQKAEQ